MLFEKVVGAMINLKTCHRGRKTRVGAQLNVRDEGDVRYDCQISHMSKLVGAGVIHRGKNMPGKNLVDGKGEDNQFSFGKVQSSNWRHVKDTAGSYCWEIMCRSVFLRV